jgi:tetratricopeptide (TPR) repeat protein
VTISNNFTWVWLNTKLGDYTLAQQLFAGTLRVARILQLAGEPKEEEDRIKRSPGFGDYHLAPEQKSKPGWTWRFPSSMSTQWIVSPEQLAVIATNGGYDSFVGVQAGNYAVGELHAKSLHCVQSFQSAIDENPEGRYLYESLGNWYKRQNDEVNAVKYYGKAIELDPEVPPNCAEDYYTLFA